LAIRAFQEGTETYVRRASQNAAEDPLNFATQEFAFNPPAEVPIVFTVDGVRADFPNHKLQIAMHHSDTPKALRYEAVIAERKGGGAVGRLDRTPLTLRNGILEAPLPAAMEQMDRPTEYQLTFRLFTDKKLVGEQRKEFTLPAPPRPNIVERVTMALEMFPWLGWSIAGIFVVLSLAYIAHSLIPRKRKPLPRPQNLAPVFIQSPPVLSPSLAGAVAYSPPDVQPAAPPGGTRSSAPAVEPPPGPSPAPVDSASPVETPSQPRPVPVDSAPAVEAPAGPPAVSVARPPGPAPTPVDSGPGAQPLLTFAFDPGTAVLVITSGPEAGRQHILTEGELSIGRADDNDIVIKDGYASRRHARIARRGDDYLWIDRDEVTQPTRINGNAVAGSHVLHHGDGIEVGETILVFQRAEPEPADGAQSRGAALPTEAQIPGRPQVAD
jgi:hypothetical protein